MTARERRARERRRRALERRLAHVEAILWTRRARRAARAAFERYVADGGHLPNGASPQLQARFEQVRQAMGPRPEST